MNITVIRGAGDKPGPKIVDPLLCTDVAGKQRGYGEVEASASKIITTTNGPAHELYETGLHFKVATTEGQWDGMLTYCQRIFEISSDGLSFNASTVMRFKRAVQK